jgi:chromosome segregation protein
MPPTYMLPLDIGKPIRLDVVIWNDNNRNSYEGSFTFDGKDYYVTVSALSDDGYAGYIHLGNAEGQVVASAEKCVRDIMLDRELKDSWEEYLRGKDDSDTLTCAERDRYNDSVRAILELRDKGLMKGIHGTVWELMTVDKGYEAALSAAMMVRGYAHAIVTEDEDAADNAISYLRERRMGRATFLPLDRMKAGKPSAMAVKREKYKEFIGYVIDLIKFEERYRAVFWFVLGDTIVTETLEDAKHIMGGVRIVTKSGELLPEADPR